MHKEIACLNEHQIQPIFTRNLPVSLHKSSKLPTADMRKRCFPSWLHPSILVSRPCSIAPQSHRHAPQDVTQLSRDVSLLISSLPSSVALLKTFPSHWGFSWPLKSKRPAVHPRGCLTAPASLLCPVDCDTGLSIHCQPPRQSWAALC